MCTDKSDIHGTLIKKYHGNQPGENINERLGDDDHDTKVRKILDFEIYFGLRNI